MAVKKAENPFSKDELKVKGEDFVNRLKVIYGENVKDSEIIQRFPFLTSQLMTNYKRRNQGVDIGVFIGMKKTDPRLSLDFLMFGEGNPYVREEKYAPDAPMVSCEPVYNISETEFGKKVMTIQNEQIISQLQQQMTLLKDMLLATEVFKTTQQNIENLLAR